MNSKEFLSELASACGMSQAETGAKVKALASVMAGKLENETSIVIPNFGTFEVKKKLERVFVNPTTKQKMLVPPKLVVGFKVATALKDKLNV